MTSRPTWKTYLYLTLVLFCCWPLLFQPAFAPIFTSFAWLQLVFFVPLLTSFICGMKYGYKLLPGLAAISIAALSVAVLIDFDILMHDETVFSGLSYIAGMILKLTCVVLMLEIAGVFMAKHSLSARSIGSTAGIVIISVYLLLSIDGSPVSYGFNDYTLKLVGVVLGAVAALTLVALITQRSSVKIKNGV